MPPPLLTGVREDAHGGEEPAGGDHQAKDARPDPAVPALPVPPPEETLVGVLGGPERSAGPLESLPVVHHRWPPSMLVRAARPLEACIRAVPGAMPSIRPASTESNPRRSVRTIAARCLGLSDPTARTTSTRVSICEISSSRGPRAMVRFSTRDAPLHRSWPSG